MWIIGFLAGSAVAIHLPEPSLLWMRGILFGTSSIVGLALCALVPFLFSILFLKHSQVILLLLLAFMKAFTYGLALASVKLIFGGAGWLVILLALFTDSCVTLLLLLFWFQNVFKLGNVKLGDCMGYLSIASLVICVDLCLISPFLSSLSYS